MTIDRAELLDHVARLTRPQAWFYGQLERAIELAAVGRDDELIEVDCRRRRAGEVIEAWELEEFVERAQRGSRPARR